MNENEAQELRTEFQGVEKRLDDLETRLDDLETRLIKRLEQSEKQRDEKFKQILDQLKETDELLRGNAGNPGMNGRLHSLETLKPFFMWAIGVTATGFVGILIAIITITLQAN